MPALITLTTDFGTASPYVAAMKGVVFGINPAARVVDLSHSIPPQDVRHAAHFLAGCVTYFPTGTIHVIVVDPGVGTARAALHIELNGQHLVAPDNGCWTLLPGSDSATVRRLEERRYFHEPVSTTFHGRDIFAPVAAHLSLGVTPDQLGPRVVRWQRLHRPAPVQVPGGWDGEIAFIDHFGNLITNLPGETLAGARSGDSRSPRAGHRQLQVCIGNHVVATQVRTYGEAPRGTPVVLVSSDDRVEIAVVEGNAARTLQATVGMPVQLRLGDEA
ncbi:MAG: S-adenosyl-l-methionine hydroxide adenosyltransferase family protein [Gemmataceae bacterium]